MADEMEKVLSYEEDPRSPCKYGKDCYQINPVHLKKYKHPSTQKRESDVTLKADSKKKKLSDTGVAAVGQTKLTANWLKVTGTEKESSTASRKEHIISESSDSESDSVDNIREVAEVRGILDSGHHSSDRNSDSTDMEQDKNKNKKLNKSEEEKIAEGLKTNVLSKRESNSTEENANGGQCVNITDSTPREIINNAIKHKFLFDMPDDFYSFWSFCRSLDKNNPADALKTCGLQLVGPYDVVAGKFNNHKLKNTSMYLTHWRYYYDPPEFQTVLKGEDRTQYHIGYFRDDPKEAPSFLGSNCANKDGVITPLGENIFGAVNTYFEASKKATNPFQKLKIAPIQKLLHSWAKENNFCLDALTPKMKNRKGKVVSKTFHMAGIVVPVQPKTDLGYRELIESDSRLKRILKMIVEADTDTERDGYLESLQPVITAANIANDECDFGTSLELGIDLFSFGGAALHRSALQLLTTAYTLLQRPEFAKIIDAHLQFRQKGTNLSILAFQ